VCVGIPKTVDNDLPITDCSLGFGSVALKDAFGHTQLGGVAPIISNSIGAKLGYKCHWAVADYLQRSARHLASETDVQQAYAVGRAAVEFAIAGRNAVMPAIRRLSDSPYRWDIIEAPLSAVANQEKLLPPEFISADGFGITEAALRYLAPLIAGEAFPPFKTKADISCAGLAPCKLTPEPHFAGRKSLM